MRTGGLLRRAVAGFATLVVALAGQPATASVWQATVVSEQPVTYTPHVAADDQVPHPLALAVGESGGTMFVGGKFTSVESADRSQTYARRNLMAFSAADGAISTNFSPDVNGPVFAVLGVGNAVYVGGDFTSINGVFRPGLAELNASTGTVIRAFKPFELSRGRVSEIRLVTGRLLVSGSFDGGLLALDPASGRDTGYLHLGITGRLLLTTTRTDVAKFAVNPQGTLLVAVGNFTTVDGQMRKRAFMVHLGGSAASLADWYYAPLSHKCRSDKATHQAYLEDVDFSPDGSYFVFVSTGFVPRHPTQIGTAVCDAAARFETDVARPTRPTWINYTGGDTLYSVAVTGAAVYVQGHNRWLDNPYGKDSAGPGAVPRLGIGAIDASSGLALDWNPAKPAVQGGHDFLATSDGLWVVSDSTKFDGQYHRGIAFAPLP
jgi:hypothetical protein